MKNKIFNLTIGISLFAISSLATAGIAKADKHNNDWKKGADEIVEKSDAPIKENNYTKNGQEFKPNQTKHKFEQPKQYNSYNNQAPVEFKQQKPPQNNDFNKNQFADKKNSYGHNDYKKPNDNGNYNQYKHNDKSYNKQYNDDWNKSYKKPDNNYDSNHKKHHSNNYNYNDYNYNYDNDHNQKYYQYKDFNFGKKNGNNYWGPHGQWSNWNSGWGNPYDYARRWGFDDYNPNKGWRKGNYWYRHPSQWSDWAGWYSFFIGTSGTWGYSYNQNYYDPYYSNYGSNCMQLQTSQWEYGRQAVYSFIACLNNWGQYEEVRGTREFEGFAF